MSIYSLNKQRSILFLLVLLCILCIILEVSLVFNNGSSSSSQDVSFSSSKRLLKSKRFVIETKEILEVKAASIQSKPQRKSSHHSAKPQLISGLNFTAGITNSSFKSANDAVEMGRKLWRELESIDKNMSTNIHDHSSVEKVEECPYSVSVSGDEFSRKGKVILLPCGLTLGSHVTVIGKPRRAHKEMNSEMEDWMVSQFVLELQGLKTVQEGETPPTILHFNPRLEGDWSGNPVIEQNSCYRMQWGPSQRCEGWRSGPDEQTVDGFVKCEKWVRGYYDRSRWLHRLIQGKKKLKIDWAFPFSEDKLFVLTLSAGVEGYHAHVNGRPVTSFPYRTGFTLGDATGLSLKGDVDVVSIFAGSLPATHPSFAPQKHLDFSNRWKAPPIPSGRVELFIGILSAGNHFAERMAVRKSWMQHQLIKSSEVVARFFVALQERKEVNEEVRKEAEFFGDIVIVPYVDKYDLVVLKTVAICEYGVRTVSANYIMKGDDDTFVRVDAIIDAAKDVQEGRSLYIGNMNYYPEPLRSGKWAVTYEEWPEGVYPTYADGPGYIISSDIAHFILSDFEMHKLKLFKMEDVSMGMWVEKFNQTTAVEYVHSLEFCQFGCVENYITAHYQSPRQMICLWNKLRRREKPLCCDMR